MKKTTLYLLVSVLFLLFSCKKSSDNSTNNTNPCANITCLNGGTCANGICNCPPGYGGSDCGTLKTPVSMTISKIDLTAYPLLNGGVGWDLTSGPDIFLSINQGVSASDIETSGIAYDMTGGTISYVTNFPVTIPTPSVAWTIGLWDYDTPDPDDFMGGIYFTPNNNDSGFPATITLTGGTISMKLYVTWNF